MPSASNTSRIAKNTLLLYFRMLLTMAVSLYTSRVILNALGVEDYGIYNVVGGVVAMVSFVSGALTTGTQRHISTELGKKDGNVPQIFSACFRIHILLSVVLLILSESFGLWFLNTQMNIPDGRMYAANVVYQFAVASFIVNVIKTPYNASVIAYERMSFYAYIGILEAVLKLAAVYVLLVCSYDKLAVYSVLVFLATVIVFVCFSAYSHKTLQGVRFVKVEDKGLYKYLLSFSGWTLFGSSTVVAEQQGLNMVVNIYYGVAVNAAVGVANQVKGAVSQFVNGYQQALNPQLVMSQSQGDRQRQFDLITKSAKYSFFILLVIAFPIILNINYILRLWLGVVPRYTMQICILTIVVEMFECLSSPLYTTIFAVGDIKRYQIIVAMFRIVSFLSGLVVSLCGAEPHWIFVPPCGVAAGLLIYRLLFVNKAIGFPLRQFWSSIAMPILYVLLVMAAVLAATKCLTVGEPTFTLFAVESIVATSLAILAIATLGMGRSERKAMVNMVLGKLDRKR